MTRILPVIIFAGGAGKRFNADKAAVLTPALAQAVHGHGLPVIISGREIAGYITVADHPRAGLGPLGGLCGGLRYARDQGFAEALSLPCDMWPFSLAIIDALQGAPCAVAAQNHLIGRWPTALAGELEAFLKCGQDRSMRAWSKHIAARRIDLAVPIRNINTQAEWLTIEDPRLP